MASRGARRSRAPDTDDEDSRANTPASTAPNDSKRMRRDADTDDEDDDDDDFAGEEISRPKSTALSLRKSQVTPGPQNLTSENRAGHQPGAIVRVKLTNFVTYTSAEFYPGPNLNMVIGPNGTGKSTLVCAICLGLGWPPKFLGRAKDPSEFVKHGSREAIIEIELQRSATMRRNPVITRTIKRDGNQSTFSTNGKQIAGREVQALANSFNIQIDNLCQFLPQDKVVEFAQLTPIELLVSTQRAVAGPEMSKHQENLKTLRANQLTVLRDDQEGQARLTNLEGRQALQQTEVERMRKRAKVKLRLERLEQSRIMIQYQEAKRISKEASERSKLIGKELQTLTDVSGPTLKKLGAKQKYEKGARASKISHGSALTTGLRNCEEKSKKITGFDEKMKEQSTEIETQKETGRKNKEKLGRSQAKLRDYQRQKAEAPENFDTTRFSEAISDLKRQMAVLNRPVPELNQRKAELRERGRLRQTNVQDLGSRLESFDTLASQQEEKLKQLSKDTWEAWNWIQKNQELFSQRIYGPPIVECSLKDLGMADAVESTLQPSDFKFITTQNNADFLQLQKKLFGSKSSEGLALHDVSLRTCTMDSLNQFRPPVTPEQMVTFGLSGWVLDYLQGPNTVLAQLCLERSLHRCGICSTEPNQQQHDELANTDIQSYVAGPNVYNFIRRKEYGAAGTSARVASVRRAKNWASQDVDLGRKAALAREHEEAKAEAIAIQKELNGVIEESKTIQARHKELEEERSDKRREKEAIQVSQGQYMALDVSIQNAEATITQTKEWLSGVAGRISEVQERLDALHVNKTEAVLEFAAATREVRTLIASLLQAEVTLIEAVSDLQVAEAQNNEIVQAIHQKEADWNEAKDLWKQQHDLAINSRDAAKKVANEAQKCADEGDVSFMELFAHVGKTLQTEENLDAEIDAEKANLELTEGGNSNIIAEFERRAKDIEILRAQVEDATARQAESKIAIADVRGRWEPRLDEIVAQINDAFSDSFARIGCAGQVAVHKSSSTDPTECTEENGGVDNGLDFANWAIHISVKFRESEPLSLLDSHRQSGGERAVSTIFYLMALQSLSRAPFRVVDEINQGMDPRNERMVHGRMVDIAAEDGGSQYFLITPKLLSGLKYRRGMTVLCIVSGENVPAARQRDEHGDWQDGPKVDFRAFVKRARELGIGGSVGRRIDSGLGLGRGFGGANQPTSVGA